MENNINEMDKQDEVQQYVTCFFVSWNGDAVTSWLLFYMDNGSFSNNEVALYGPWSVTDNKHIGLLPHCPQHKYQFYNNIILHSRVFRKQQALK